MAACPASTESCCSLCDGPLTVALSAFDRNRRITTERFRYFRCQQCRTLQLVPTPADIGRYYPAEYYLVPQDRAALLATAGGERYKLELVRRFGAGVKLVEIGPAVGAFLAVMQEAGFETSAIEMDAECSEFLRSALGIPVQETDDPIVGLPAQAPFDVVAMWHVIEHLPNPREVLAAAAASLRPGGIIVLAAPNPDALQFRLLRSRWTHLDAPRHLVLIPPARLAELGAQMGLEVALLTTGDEGTLAWNRFGWRESLAGFARSRYPRSSLRLVGSALAWVMAPLDRRRGRGSTYTMVLRRSA